MTNKELIQVVWREKLNPGSKPDMYYRKQFLFYSIKTIICIALGLWKEEEEGNWNGYYDIACYNERAVYHPDAFNAFEWDTIRIGEGIFKNWYYEIRDDTNI